MSCREYLKDLQIHVEQSKSKGRYLVSERPIAAGMNGHCVVSNVLGTTIMMCKPLSFAVTNEKQQFVCQSCYKEYPKLMTCSKCGYARYCCRQCQVNDWWRARRIFDMQEESQDGMQLDEKVGGSIDGTLE